MFRFYQFVHQSCGRGEACTPPLTARCDTQPRGKMRLTGTRRVRNIMPIDRRSSRFTISFILCLDRIFACGDG